MQDMKYNEHFFGKRKRGKSSRRLSKTFCWMQLPWWAGIFTISLAGFHLFKERNCMSQHKIRNGQNCSFERLFVLIIFLEKEKNKISYKMKKLQSVFWKIQLGIDRKSREFYLKDPSDGEHFGICQHFSSHVFRGARVVEGLE